VELRSAPAEPDLRATRLAIPAGAVVDLSESPGSLVLRSQTSIEVRGRLVRHGTGRASDPLTQELEGAEALPGSHRPSFSSWLQSLLHPEQPGSRGPWTVLIAGGDLRVAKGASIEVDGPLVLVAGGLIRVEGTVHTSGRLWRSLGGGG